MVNTIEIKNMKRFPIGGYINPPPDWMVNLFKNPDNKIIAEGVWATFPMYWFHLYLSTECTRKCADCYTFSHYKNKIVRMDDRTFSKLCEWLPEMYNKQRWLVALVSFLGGEPLLDTPRIKLMMDSVHKNTHGMVGSVNTNGDVLDSVNWSDLEHIQHWSLNPCDTDMDEIERRLNIIISRSSILLSPSLFIVLDDFNLSRIEELTRFSIENNIQPKMIKNCSKGNDEEYKKYLLKKMHIVCDILEDYKTKGYKINTTWLLNYFPPRLKAKERKICGKGTCSVSPEGNISVCAKGALNCSTTTAGSIWDDNAVDLLKEQAKYIAFDHTREGNSKECLTCDLRFQCDGGCVFDRYITYGKFVGPFPYCQLHKEIFPRLEYIHCD